MAAAILFWLFASLVLFVFRCGDNCGPGTADHWRYTAQFVLAGLGGGLGLIALVRGFTAAQQPNRVLLMMSLGCALTWVFWVYFLGGF